MLGTAFVLVYVQVRKHHMMKKEPISIIQYKKKKKYPFGPEVSVFPRKPAAGR